MSLNNLFENYLFKKRYIFRYYLKPFENDGHVHFFSMVDGKAIDIMNNADARLLALLTRRMDNSAWMFFYYRKGHEILGYSFLHVPKQEEWSDSLPTMPGEARVSSNYVYPQHRGKKIRGLICKQQINYAEKNNLDLWCVIENSNTESLRAEAGYCSTRINNYLIKIYARNLISIVTKPFRIYFLLGRKRARR